MSYEEHGLINITMELAIPRDVMGSKEEIANYLNKMLYEDPEFFGDFAEENITVVQESIDAA